MKKIIHSILLISLVCFSFFYTDKVINMVNQKNPLMIEINDKKDDYNILPVGAIVDEDTIIPGIKGREVDVIKSYENMKTGGIFREDALIFKDLSPSNSIDNNLNKYIVKGNSSKKEASLITIYNENNLSKIKEIENLTIFINHKDLNSDIVNNIKNKEIYSYGNNGSYNKQDLTNDNTFIKRLTKNNPIYCLTKEKNNNVLSVCNEKNMYVVLPNIIGNYLEIKNNLTNGSIILLDNLNEVDTIIKYIKSKGYKIVNLSTLLSE